MVDLLSARGRHPAILNLTTARAAVRVTLTAAGAVALLMRITATINELYTSPGNNWCKERRRGFCVHL